MPEYLYRREDGSTFSIRQKFSEDPLRVDSETGQKVVRIVQPTGVIFKGSGFYVNDSKNASKQTLSTSNGSNGASGEKKTNDTKPAENKKSADSGTTETSKESGKTNTSLSNAAD